MKSFLSHDTWARLRMLAKNFPVAWSLYGAYWAVRSRRELATRYSGNASLLPWTTRGNEPTLASPGSQLCTASQFLEPRYANWCAIIGSPPRLSRKQWEFVFILETLSQADMLAPGRRGLGFGCGKEPLPAVFARFGCEVLATDLDIASAAGAGWVDTLQHSSHLEDLYGFHPTICSRERFFEKVRFRVANMNEMPADLTGFDFTWSACAFEHLGSIRRGLDFVRNSVRCLAPGGVAVHTTEFNLSSEDRTLEDPNCVIFRRRDIEQLARELSADGHEVAPLNLNAGGLPVDRHVDLPPYRQSPNLKAKLAEFVTTSIGLVVRARAA